MTNDERERAAAFILAHVDEADAVALVDRLDRFDAETLVCRRGAPVKKPGKREASS